MRSLTGFPSFSRKSPCNRTQIFQQTFAQLFRKQSDDWLPTNFNHVTRMCALSCTTFLLKLPPSPPLLPADYQPVDWTLQTFQPLPDQVSYRKPPTGGWKVKECREPSTGWADTHTHTQFNEQFSRPLFLFVSWEGGKFFHEAQRENWWPFASLVGRESLIL